MEDEVANYRCSDEASCGEDVGDCIDVFVGGKVGEDFEEFFLWWWLWGAGERSIFSFHV